VAAASYLRKTGREWVAIGLLGAMVVLCADAFYSPPLVERFFWAGFALVGVMFGLCRAESVATQPAVPNPQARWPMAYPAPRARSHEAEVDPQFGAPL
jgi:hypothetical protein